MKIFLLFLFLSVITTCFGQWNKWYSMNSFGSFGTTLNMNGGILPGISFSSGMGVGEHLSVGATIDFLRISATKKVYSPVSFNVRYFFNNKSEQPYLSINGGYGFYRYAETLIGEADRRITSGNFYYAAALGLNVRRLGKSNFGPYVQIGFKNLPFQTKTFFNDKVIYSSTRSRLYPNLDIGIRL